ncbi:unnamed protein product [Cuscuta epithymum]|uniref:Uncharacterized protein n=1 Tax=Cuscuta epithymum TaxID=186058 RepID=A0AAV0CZE8_9ASTE|nr:unnamed protein product [Cuscuta epithymum]
MISLYLRVLEIETLIILSIVVIVLFKCFKVLTSPSRGGGGGGGGISQFQAELEVATITCCFEKSRREDVVRASSISVLKTTVLMLMDILLIRNCFWACMPMLLAVCGL